MKLGLYKWGGGWDVDCITQNVHLNVEFFPPSCGVLYAKRGGDGGVAVWEQLVCDPPRWPVCCWEAMAVAKEQVTKATVVAMEQVVMAVVRAVSWCMRWCGEVRSRGTQADTLNTVPSCACGFLRLSQRERNPRFVFQICLGVSLFRAILWECVWPRKVCKQMYLLKF